jgi:hypothetical protein
MMAGMGQSLPEILFWGLVATAVMTTILQAGQGLGFSRMSLPYMFGTFFTPNRHWAYVIGFVTYLVGGWLFAMLYYALFVYVGQASWWLGGLVGLIHGAFLLIVMLPLMPHIHPRMASEFDGPTSRRRLEPPGFLGLHFGHRTPLITLLGQLVYGIVLGAFLTV